MKKPVFEKIKPLFQKKGKASVHGSYSAGYTALFLAVLLTMTLGFELYYRISGKKYDGLLGQYRASRTRDENSRGKY